MTINKLECGRTGLRCVWVCRHVAVVQPEKMLRETLWISQRMSREMDRLYGVLSSRAQLTEKDQC